MSLHVVGKAWGHELHWDPEWGPVCSGVQYPTEICFLAAYHSSFMVHWWVRVHCGQIYETHTAPQGRQDLQKFTHP